MRCLCVLLLTLTVVLENVACQTLAKDPCQESPWLCNELAQMRSVLSEQKELIVSQRGMLSEQQSEISLLKSKVQDQQDAIHQLQTQTERQDKKLLDQDQLLRHWMTSLQQVLHSPAVDKPQQQAQESAWNLPRDAHKLTSSYRDVAPRADDGGPLEAVVSQMGQQLTAVTADVQALKNSHTQQDLNIQDARTSTFVHWGSSHCPSDAELVYTGAMGGSPYSLSGGGSNYLCLTMSPVFGTHPMPAYYAVLYGSEYQTYNDAHYDQDAMCAVCRARHATTITIPGTNVCTPGWTKQYDGYLMAERDTHPGSSEFICVDEAMESRPGTNRNDDGRLLFFTITHCGSLPCAPYEDNKMVTCVVCSK